ncbi:hypothetical protein BDN67DRAFT_915943, partial [Paxillus ammoniavirescens]
IFKNHLEWALATRGVVNHLSGKAPKPTPPGDSAMQDQLDNYAASVAEWQKPEFTCSTIMGMLLIVFQHSTLWKILHSETVADMWTTITKEYKLKMALVQAGLCVKFQNLLCPEKGDLQAHLDKLQASCEELASVGVTLTDSEYSSNII